MTWNRILSKKEFRGQVGHTVTFLATTLRCVSLLKSEKRQPLIGKKKKRERESYLGCSIVHSVAIVRLIGTSPDLPASSVLTGTGTVIEVVTFSRI